MKTKHIHEFKIGKSNKVKICSCGKFEHINLKPEDVIKGIEAKHTPGPWNMETGHKINCGHDYAEIYAKDASILVCDVLVNKNSADGKGVANARLIAAAPELLEALYNAVNVLRLALDNGAWDKHSNDEKDSFDEVQTVLNIAREALAKAEGR